MKRTIRKTLRTLQKNLGEKKKMPWSGNQGKMYMQSLIQIAMDCTTRQINEVDKLVDHAPVKAFDLLCKYGRPKS